jgi:hypothetical protein
MEEKKKKEKEKKSNCKKNAGIVYIVNAFKSSEAPSWFSP